MNDTQREAIIDTTFAFYPAIFVFGILGNMLAFLTFSRVKFKNSPYAVYFRFLVATDTFVVLKAIHLFAKHRYHKSIFDISDAWCRIWLYSTDAPELASGTHQ